MNKEIIFALYYNKTNDNGHGYWYSANTEVLADIRNPTPEPSRRFTTGIRTTACR